MRMVIILLKTYYSVDKQKLKQNIIKLKEKMCADRFFYAVKANAEEPVMATLAEEGIGFEIASIEEFDRVKQNKEFNEKNIICGLPVKPVALIRSLYEYGVRYFVFDRIGEYYKLQENAPLSKKIVRLYVKDIDGESAEWGMQINDIICLIDAGYCIDGVSFHIPRNYQIKHIDKVMKRIEMVLSVSNKEMIVNVGGGYRPELQKHLALRYDIDKFYTIYNGYLKDIKRRYGAVIYCEPGRGIVESACHIVAEVVLAEQSNDLYRIFLNINIGSVVGSHPYRIMVIGTGEEECIYSNEWHIDRNAEEKRITTSFIDTICEYKIFFTLPLKRPLKQGEILRFEGMGAYTFSQAYDFHCRKRIQYIED